MTETKPDLAGELALCRGLLETAPDALVVADQEGVIRLVNAQTERLFGYPRHELIGGPVARLVPEGFADSQDRRADGASIEATGCRADGAKLALEINLARATIGGEILVSAAIRDATDRRALEQTIRDTSRSKSEFLVGLSHELRTPLNAIIGFTELMHRGGAGPLEPQQHEYLGDVLTSARHLLQLINNVLDLAKIEAGKIELRPEEVDIAALVCEVRDTLRALAAGKGLSIVLGLDPSVGLVVVDPSRVRQVLYNYLSNAIKFTPEGGTITLRVDAAGADFFRLAVSDTGVGIASDDLGRLFSDYQQVGASDGRRRQGTGLGLALTKRIVEAHGGQVEVTSVQSVGSTFSAVFPRLIPRPAVPRG